ncbi:16S rRNA (guanine(527)-N(7))-methyltransferase RsmG [Micromonospora sp. WMMD882]|uniref:16S rRNA (guanine(527)-N(7))-methyltransferase RsmG n=1 Tax=Micromonospora sp. WMMD882 TaxID=3015151 RepID=UPI00248C5D4B|nr:16S rRNA (guanine(527)-N(7))-methyltransferase RsmG [Micromonospora sp. WMMD882]WBB78315.1 16S rRNA (guanine(527)-N(7))-methyltransferase RsmG [Micromonospora sp. WMMD882]
MTADATAGASGPGGTPPGPSPVSPRPTTEPSGVTSAGPPAESDLPEAPAPTGSDLPAKAGASADADLPVEPGAPTGADLPAELAESARTLFGERLDLATRYAELLVTDGVLRGLIGPREAPRIWDRHLLNCAAIAERIPEGATVVDVGSGAGLPGLVLAIARPDLTVTLVEPLARRTSFLVEAVEGLRLTRTVRVVRGRADEAAAGVNGLAPVSADVVTARAVAPLDRLAGWCLPLTVRGGRLLAMKGSSADEEVAGHAAAVARLGGGDPEVRRCGVGVIDPPTIVVEIVRERLVGPVRKPPRAARRGGRPRGR